MLVFHFYERKCLNIELMKDCEVLYNRNKMYKILSENMLICSYLALRIFF